MLLCFSSCEEKGLLTNANDVSYIIFSKNMLTDTTKISFQEYREDQSVVQIPLEMTIYGKIQDKDAEYTISIDPVRTTYLTDHCVLPETCVIKAGELTGTIEVGIMNYDALKTETKILALKVNEGGDIREGAATNARAILAITDRLFKPQWWSVNDATDGGFLNMIEEYYLGEYSETKYKMFLEELQKDGETFDGKDMNKLRKYCLRLKNTLKERKEAGDPVREGDKEITVPIAG